MEGHLRGIVGLLKVEEIVKEPEIVAGRVRDSVSDDLTKMGLEVVSFTIKKVIDEKDYINNMGRPDVARIKREADIAQAEAERDTAIKRAMAMREAAVAQAAGRPGAGHRPDRVGDQAGRGHARPGGQAGRIRRGGPRAARRRREGLRHRRQPGAAAGHRRAGAHRPGPAPGADQGPGAGGAAPRAGARSHAHQAGRGRAAANRDCWPKRSARGWRTRRAGQAEATRLQGTAEAEIVRAKGQAEADAMHLRAAAYQEYSQAAVLDKLHHGHARGRARASQSLASVDKITIVSTGDGRPRASARSPAKWPRWSPRCPSCSRP